MDVNDLRSAVTVAGLILFVALWAWTWSARRKRAHDEAAMLPFAGDDEVPAGNEHDRRLS
ncbi:MAG: CcoQ/FixQ family Cbb3-type cytochrome c oxidase assembly chaperone [Rhodoferax sp.]|jgi:cytochrome c oxidase cbb3-type subunit 4|nr:CcoQ/FixQ family Cbb3-type cytochrome c oxidase assembly chaperone [Rhodoferax sp.]MCL4740318.1 CcoQ/FixQ family Cbb3-type cytochrome c oxidase assembly chaperone [Burkholderiaceae bacterium]MCP5289112.1 CcoQ/FixQ family Cbb3-type cytochrome c oxidase assembly chaperone [Burkholderiaceae bacterium]HMQ72042.1 CcoQ/FixQ family Cbb3-type cytochrome c oxidase assembly chaperone [Rubrivivax sp.]